MTAQRLSGSARSGRAMFIADAAAAVAVSVVSALFLPSHLTLPAAVLAGVAIAVEGLSVAGRRLAPFTAALVAVGATVACQRATGQALLDVAPYALILNIYTAATVGLGRRQLQRLIALLGVSLGAVTVLTATAGQLEMSTVVKAAIPVVVAPAVAGLFVVWRRNLTRELEITRALLEDENELRVALAATSERNRLARELHDVVTHAVSVMVVQAGAARIMLSDESAAALVRLERIAVAGREALNDLRRLVGSAAAAERGHKEAALDGVARLVEVCRRMSDVGLPTEFLIEGDPSHLSDDLQQVLYRVGQEALTNALKHAAPGSATISLRITQAAVEIRVVSRVEPPRTSAVASEVGGHGLTGMAERVHRIGGEVRSGCMSDGSFEVWAQLPPFPDRRVDLRRWHHSAAPRVWQAWQRRRRIGFALIALVALELNVLFSNLRRGSVAMNCAVAAAMALALLWRSNRPLVFCLLVTALALPLSGGIADMDQATIVSTFVFVLPIYTVAAWADLRSAAIGLAAALLATVVTGAWHGDATAIVVDNGLLTVLLWGAGRLIRAQRDTAADLVAASDALVVERADRERQLAELERARILGELQASVLRDITAMVELADRMLQDRRRSLDESDAETISVIEDTGRTALANLREILGALRPAATTSPPSVLQAVPV